jgi:hypothetical protein
MTWLAVMVVPLVIPSTTTLTPFLMALAEVELVPFWYFVVDAFLTVTFCPAAVVSVKLDVDTLLTVPDAPPTAGPDRALDPPFAIGGAFVVVVLVVVVLAAAEPLLAVAPTIP